MTHTGNASQPNSNKPDVGAGMLDYYIEHGISPVRYSIADLGAHFDRRDSLYRGLGLPPVAFKGCDVLEVAPGSGQNGLYIAASKPAVYELVEPNPTAIRDIAETFVNFELPHTKPTLHSQRLEAFAPGRQYDIVICENWLGGSPHERALMRKLAGLVRPGGVLVMTMVPLTGMLSNIIRKLLAMRLVDRNLPFEEQAEILTAVFGKHLQTMKSMTRSHRDWVIDNLLNPHYLNVALTLDMVLDEIGSSMEMLSSIPRVVADWRWFKSLVREERDYNSLFRKSFHRNLHNFFDYRREFPPRSAEKNLSIESLCGQLHAAALSWEGIFNSTGQSDRACAETIDSALSKLSQSLGAIDPELEFAVREARSVWNMQAVEARHIEEMKYFSGMFGREAVYISFVVNEGSDHHRVRERS